MSVGWDVLIIGRSYAALSAALNLGRARRSVLVVGNGGPRTHGLITQDGAAPGDIITAAEKELDTYPTVELVDDRVTTLAVVDGGFRASIGKRTSTASTVIRHWRQRQPAPHPRTARALGTVLDATYLVASLSARAAGSSTSEAVPPRSWRASSPTRGQWPAKIS